MRTKKVNRYYCDFCKKSGGSAYHMRRHEAGCTANPNRQCGMCNGAGYDAADLPVLIALLPNAAAFKGQMEWADGSGESSQYSEYPWLEECVDACMPALKEAAEGCPACMLAALRQSGCIGFAEFNWMEERERFLRDANELRWEGVACGGLG